MTFRIARHTSDLSAIQNFYCQLLGMKVLGSFQDHDNYDGIFLGFEKENWHLEFTASKDAPQHHPDEDDLLVFYADSDQHCEDLKRQFSDAGYLL